MGVGGMVLTFGGVSRYGTWVFTFKDYNTATQISGETKEVLVSLVVSITGNDTFLGKINIIQVINQK